MAKQSRRKSEQNDEIDVTEAVERAIAFLSQVFTDPGIKDLRLEEVEFVDNENRWLVTLSFLRPIPKEERPVWERGISHSDYRREYKAVDVDAHSGKARSIKMRSPV